ncbi:hypothetical protein CDAR_281101 [Caerostris darwini]|uniref:Uncharacterized protein n=1 Tax=Caerostris darwini TaxID=1538125 RepID=A0AAV4NC48_9ARAC|nr:hypothetical protein CDAR_281101 [Caerostris darwini]
MGGERAHPENSLPSLLLCPPIFASPNVSLLKRSFLGKDLIRKRCERFVLDWPCLNRPAVSPKVLLSVLQGDIFGPSSVVSAQRTNGTTRFFRLRLRRVFHHGYYSPG